MIPEGKLSPGHNARACSGGEEFGQVNTALTQTVSTKQVVQEKESGEIYAALKTLLFPGAPEGNSKNVVYWGDRSR